MERHELARLLGIPLARDGGLPRLVLERSPEAFMRAFAEAVAGGGPVFLGNPEWSGAERASAARHLEARGGEGPGWLMIPSGGSSGEGLRFARHDAGTLAAAVRGFCTHFGMERVNCLGLLPLNHVSGLMAWMRCLQTGGAYLPWNWKELEAGRFPPGLPDPCCVSLVPTQLQRLMRSEAAVGWLKAFQVVFVGGAPAWAGLLDEAARLGLRLSPGYGATETAAMVAALRPEEFLNGARGCGRALPHARIEVGPDGSVTVAGDSVFRGYFPQVREDRTWATGDIGEVGPDGSLHILGRSDDVVITGGKKVAPREVEEALRASGQFEDVAVIGLADPEWGQVVVACHPRAERAPSRESVDAALAGLPSYKRPKRYIALSQWPRNAQGKINRAELARLAVG